MSVMDFLTKRRAKHTVVVLDAWTHYRSLLEQFAAGSEVDVDTADLILQKASKSEHDLQRDIDTFQRRQAWAAQLQSSQNAEVERYQAERELQNYRDQIAALQQKLQPKIDEALQRLRTAEITTSIASGAVQSLRDSVLDPHIVTRRSELDRERKELASRKREVEEFIRGAHAEHWANVVAGIDSQLNGQRNIPLDPVQKSTFAKERVEAVKHREQAEVSAAPRRQELEVLNVRWRELEQESAELARQSLQP